MYGGSFDRFTENVSTNLCQGGAIGFGSKYDSGEGCLFTVGSVYLLIRFSLDKGGRFRSSHGETSSLLGTIADSPDKGCVRIHGTADWLALEDGSRFHSVGLYKSVQRGARIWCCRVGVSYLHKTVWVKNFSLGRNRIYFQTTNVGTSHFDLWKFVRVRSDQIRGSSAAAFRRSFANLSFVNREFVFDLESFAGRMHCRGEIVLDPYQ